MKNNTKFGALGLVLICLTVSAIFGIAYAAFTKTLSVSGSTSVSSTKWEVKFTSMAKNTANSTSDITIQTPTVNNTSITNWGATFTKPGQKVEYDLVVTNSGNFKAKYSSTSGLTVTCSVGVDETATSAVNVCKYINYTITKSDGSALSSSDEIAANGGTLNLKVTLEYKNKTVSDNTDIVEGDLPTQAVTVTAGTTTLNFVQA